MKIFMDNHDLSMQTDERTSLLADKIARPKQRKTEKVLKNA